MALFKLFGKPSQGTGPYKEAHLNQLYELLFCDNPELYRPASAPYAPPFDVLFSENAAALQAIAEDLHADVRMRLLAYRKLKALGHGPAGRKLLAIIVEIGFPRGLDVLAVFADGTARYINQSGKLLVWEITDDEKANAITHDLFFAASGIVSQIGGAEATRLPHPRKGNLRISFLSNQGLAFGEGPINDMFKDAVAGPALEKASLLMEYLLKKAAK